MYSYNSFKNICSVQNSIDGNKIILYNCDVQSLHLYCMLLYKLDVYIIKLELSFAR